MTSNYVINLDRDLVKNVYQYN